MRLPIVYALSYPDRVDMNLNRLDFSKHMSLSFAPPDNDRFPCLLLAYKALEMGGGTPTVLNAANEIAVNLFLTKKIAFNDIYNCAEFAIENVKDTAIDSIGDVHRLDEYTRKLCLNRFLEDK